MGLNTQPHQVCIISGSLLAQEMVTDAPLSHLLKLIEQCITSMDHTDPAIANLWPICQSVYVYEEVLLYQDQEVVPLSLCSPILRHLHAVHQETSAMEQRQKTSTKQERNA